jgi:hypothetical protein
MYEHLLTIVDSVTHGRTTKISALLWMQGERDARIPEAGKAYYQNFDFLIESIRTDFNSPNLPIIYAKVNPPKENYPALTVVNEAQLRIEKNVRNAYLIETDGIEKWNDKLHYSSTGQLELGRRFGLKLTEILRD